MSQQEIGRPASDEYAPDFSRYVARVPETDILSTLAKEKEEFLALLSGIPANLVGYRYAEGKWSVRQVIGHVIDSERVFGYRALSIARSEQSPLPGFDEAQYADASSAEEAPLEELQREFASLRESHELMFRHLSRGSWLRKGTANGFPVTARALAYIIVGHARHHTAVLNERYLLRP
ncbi:MAG: DinB family protein [Bacteroidota bacterium]